ncbi:Uncharacterised protein [Vibrio cholerae]|uniref:Uncharacterized protein n=1 Tax=Vibrio cholerae TaxID=666 RepID=A0A655RYT0_VIBCL|nr:Uncharacterised protein [Vibrio cholerae]CSB10774.1 Uncharacterised protein [Vibrio cholerae]CSB86015.1 Uncharacterised protein [Vibrio cholerae]CSC20023.1 Uncharacterised protein [Vibrio cholerae]CSC99334.1 Uncharacterised protein [Vibrio cholerae]
MIEITGLGLLGAALRLKILVSIPLRLTCSWLSGTLRSLINCSRIASQTGSALSPIAWNFLRETCTG